jgi:hypothetical protein
MSEDTIVRRMLTAGPFIASIYAEDEPCDVYEIVESGHAASGWIAAECGKVVDLCSGSFTAFDVSFRGLSLGAMAQRMIPLLKHWFMLTVYLLDTMMVRLRRQNFLKSTLVL